MSAAQLEARRKAGLSTSNPTHACSGAISNAKPDCEEKRDPDKRSLIIQKKENELDPHTQLEKPPLTETAPLSATVADALKEAFALLTLLERSFRCPCCQLPSERAECRCNA